MNWRGGGDWKEGDQKEESLSWGLRCHIRGQVFVRTLEVSRVAVYSARHSVGVFYMIIGCEGGSDTKGVTECRWAYETRMGWEATVVGKQGQVVPFPNNARTAQTFPAACFSTRMIGSAGSKRMLSEPHPLRRMKSKHSVSADRSALRLCPLARDIETRSTGSRQQAHQRGARPQSKIQGYGVTAAVVKAYICGGSVGMREAMPRSV